MTQSKLQEPKRGGPVGVFQGRTIFEGNVRVERGACECVTCQMSREFQKAEPDVKQLDRLSDWMLEEWGSTEMMLAHLLDAAERMCRRLDAPDYLREAVRIVREG